VTSTRFQSAVAALVTDRGFRGRVLDGGGLHGLSDAEREHVVRLAHDPGVMVTAHLIASFRLGKVVSLLPRTREVLGNELLAEELVSFWQAEPPTSFYAPDEVLAFSAHLRARVEAGALDRPMLLDVVTQEEERLRARRP
jgi:hypothetical protein